MSGSQSEARSNSGDLSNGPESNSPAKTANGAGCEKPVDPDNPLGFPTFLLNTGDKFNGHPIWRPPMIPDFMAHHKHIRSLPMKEDDVFLAAYPKCGTHWMSEILYMLTRGSCESYNNTKEFTMLEFLSDTTVLNATPSPRIINSHYYMKQLPEDIVNKRIKVVHVVRNPKDTAVSMFHHLRQHGAEGLTWENFLKGYVIDEYISPSHQFDYLRNISDFEKAHPDHPIKHVHFEDLKMDPVPVLLEVAQFLGIEASEKFCGEVAEACGFNKLKEADEARDMPEHLQVMMMKSKQKKLKIYRKGLVGDWKNYFTVAQNEMFDEFIRQQTEKGVAFTFKGY